MLKRNSNSKRVRRGKVSGPVLAVELSGAFARVLKGERDGESLRIEAGASGPLALDPAGQSDPAAVGAALGKLLEESRIKPGQAVMAVPRAQLVLRTLALPRLDSDSETATLVHFQIARDLPFRMEEAVVDFTLLEAASQGGVEEGAPKAQALVAAAQRSAIDFYTAVAQAAGLKLVGLAIQPYAHTRALELQAGEPDGGAAALVTVTKGDITVDVAHRGGLLFSRNSSLAHHEPGIELADVSTIEVARTLHGYSGGAGAVPISRVYVSGSTGAEQAIAEKLSERLGLPCSRLEFKEISGAAEHSAGVSPATAGLLLQATDTAGLPFDLLNPKKPAPPRNTRRAAMIAAAAAVVLLVAGVLAARAYLIRGRQSVQRDLTAQLAALEKDRKTYRAMIQQAKAIEGWAASGKDWLAHYAHLSSLLPGSEELYISAYSVAPNGTIRLGVHAKSGEVLARAEKQLRSAGYEVKPVAITPAADRFGYEFRSNVEMVPSKNLKIDLSKQKAPERPPDDASLDAAAYKKGAG